MPSYRYQWYFTWISFFAGLLWISYLCLNSPGVSVHDEVTHFFMSRDAWHTPELMLDLWGRPINTISYMPFALFGLQYARLASIIFASLTVLLTMRLAKYLDVDYAFLIPTFLWFQPWFSDLSYACVTEVPLSLMMVLGLCLLLSQRYALSAIIFGLLPLIRNEAIVFTGFWCLFCIFTRKWRLVIVSFMPLIIYNLVFFAVYHSWAFGIYFAPKTTDMYGRGEWPHFPKFLLSASGAGFLISALTLYALIPIIRSVPRLLVFACYAVYLMLHMIIFRFGLYASGGYGLFLLPLAPAMAIAAALGFHFLITEVSARLQSRGLSYVCVIICLVVVLFALNNTKPRPLDLEGVVLKEAAAWVRQERLSENKIVAVHPWFYYFLPLQITYNKRTELPSEMPPGTLVIWERHYAEHLGLVYNAFVANGSEWQCLKEFGDGLVVIFRKLAHSHP